MPVRRITRPPARALPRRAAPPSGNGTAPPLPDGPKDAVGELLRYVLLVYGREKIGKTTWAASYPDALFLSTEPGTKGLRIHEYNAEDGGCRNWGLVRSAVGLLEEQPDRYKTVVIDTADRAYELCLDHVCAELGIDHPGVSPDGKEDFGKSWKAVRKEFTDVIHRILQTGRGLVFTSHSKEENYKARTGEPFTRIHPSMSGQARAVVEALVDMFFYADYMRAPDGETRRVLVTEGNDLVWAGHRAIEGADGEPVRLPRLLPMMEKGGYALLQAAFAGRDVGLDPASLLPSKTASKAVREFYQAVRTAPRAARVPIRKVLVRR